MKLHELQPAAGSSQKAKRKGRGMSSGHGKTAGKGHKGQLARSGSKGPYFEGGQMPLSRRVPKRGFHNIFAKKYAVVNLTSLARFSAGTVVDEQLLLDTGIVRNRKDGIKLLANGEINQALTVRLTAFSETAKEKIEKAGGKAEVI